MYDRAGLLEAVAKLRVWQRGGRRAPHKPLLLLIALGELLRGNRELPFDLVESRLRELLADYAPPVKGRHQPELPYWHLQSDGLWEVPGGDELDRQRGGFPRMSALRQTKGALPASVAEQLQADRALLIRVVHQLLTDHFPESIHDNLLEATGLQDIPTDLPPIAAEAGTSRLTASRTRNPDFRRLVLRAYEHRCAATGFRASLGRQYLGTEAAHLMWHSHGGPDVVGNGLVLDPTMHLLLDRGAWSLTDDRHVLVSAEFSGSDEAVDRLRSLHGKPLRKPLPGHEPVRVEFIRWHRDTKLGGVFRTPALGGG